ncbi:MAG TPA: DUF3352 domain-containing protein [Oryzihumus sp.]|nr:DUF3352 domain-containing protein [Oryzihumus sp.]
MSSYEPDPARPPGDSTPTEPAPVEPTTGEPTPGEPTPAEAVAAPVDPAAPDEAAPPRHRRGPVIWGLVALAVVALALTAAAFGMKLVGGGPQPDTLVPSTALAYLRVDTDPSIGQKVSAVRFLQKVPQVKGALDSGDPRKRLVDALIERSGTKDLSYTRDIEPWLGDRLAFALLPPKSEGAEPEPLLVVQVKDEAKARAGIARLSADNTDKPEVTFKDGYALLTSAGNGKAVTDAIAKATLADTTTYAGDVAAVGDQGIASGWLDLGGMAKAGAFKDAADSGKLSVNPFGSGPDLQGTGRVAFALRFDADAVELVGVSRGATGLKKPATTAGSTITRLPADTAVALSVSGLDQVVGQAWGGILKGISAQSPGQDVDGELKAMESQLGISLPGDLQTLLGRNLVLAVPDQDFASGNAPQFGARVTTDATKADAVVTRLERLAIQTGAELPIVHQARGDQFYLASSRDYLGKLSADGTLGDSAAFTAAVPDVKDAQYVLFADLDRLEKSYLDQVPAQDRELVRSLRAVGASGSVTGNGEARFTLRVVGN